MATKMNTMIFAGMARLPKEFTGAEVFQVIAELDAATGKVLDVEIAPRIPLILELLKPMLIGQSLSENVNDVVQRIELRLFHRAKKAVIVAVKDMAREYRESLAPKPLPISPDPYNR
jgi:Domain of unknown function (DUF3870)